MKLTKRKGFNFLRSYFDVYNKLQTDKDKLAFVDAIINKQFLNKDPDSLEFPVDLAWDSQINAIDSSVKGWIRAEKTDLQGNPLNTPQTPPRGKTPTHPKEEQEQEEEKEQEQVYTKSEFLKDWNDLRTKHLNKPSFLNSIQRDAMDNFKSLIENYDREQFKEALVGLFKQNKMPNGNTTMQSNPRHFLSHFESYLTAYHDRNTALYGENKKEY